MRNRDDLLSKELSDVLLSAYGDLTIQREIVPEVLHADVRYDPDPAFDIERERLGLFGRLSSTPCLIEFFSSAIDSAELRGCLTKHFVDWNRRRPMRSSVSWPSQSC